MCMTSDNAPMLTIRTRDRWSCTKRNCVYFTEGTSCTTEQGGSLIVQDDGEQRVVDLEPVRVVDESQPLEFLHEDIHAPSRGADHFRQRLLRDRRHGPHGMVMLAVPRHQQEPPGQPLLAGV